MRVLPEKPHSTMAVLSSSTYIWLAPPDPEGEEGRNMLPTRVPAGQVSLAAQVLSLALHFITVI